MNDDFVQTDRAKGVRDKEGAVGPRRSERALLPTIILTFLSLGFIFGGAITIESIFSWPGLGLLTVQAIGVKDFPLLQGLFAVLDRGDLREPHRRHRLLLPRPAREGRLMP